MYKVIDMFNNVNIGEAQTYVAACELAKKYLDWDASCYCDEAVSGKGNEAAIFNDADGSKHATVFMEVDADAVVNWYMGETNNLQ
jgi:hypothetical protein